MANDLQFPASAANSLVEGYCSEFVQLAASLAQTLEQVSMRNLRIDESRDCLARVERGMRELAEAIGTLLAATPSQGKPGVPDSGTTGTSPGATPREQPGAARPRPGLRPHTPTPAAAVTEEPESEGAPAPGRPGAAAIQGPCIIQGNKDTMPITSVFQFIARMRKSGTLLVNLDGENITFDFAEGFVVFTATDNAPPDERIGDLLVEKGFLEQQHLEQFLTRYEGAIQRIGATLVQERLISNGALLEALETQVQRRFYRLLTSQQLNYSFHENAVRTGDGRIRVTPAELLYAARCLERAQA